MKRETPFHRRSWISALELEPDPDTSRHRRCRPTSRVVQDGPGHKDNRRVNDRNFEKDEKDGGRAQRTSA